MKKKLLWNKIKIILLDVDGVLTDGNLTYTDNGTETKQFNVKDGRGIIVAQWADIKFGIITARKSKIILRRAKELGITYIYQNISDKGKVLKELVEKYDYKLDEILYVGDELIDLPIMLKVGIGVAVADSASDVLKYADYITKANGGHGAVREIIEVLLKKQKKWKSIVEKHFQ